MTEHLWGDWRDWADWRERSAELIAADIREKNAGRWPQTLQEWRAVASRYRLNLMILGLPLTNAAQRHDNLIVVRYTDDQQALFRRIGHEIAEVVAQREGSLRTFHFFSAGNECHQVACLVERLLPSST